MCRFLMYEVKIRASCSLNLYIRILRNGKMIGFSCAHPCLSLGENCASHKTNNCPSFRHLVSGVKFDDSKEGSTVASLPNMPPNSDRTIGTQISGLYYDDPFSDETSIKLEIPLDYHSLDHRYNPAAIRLHDGVYVIPNTCQK
jgi:hypothetical protein